MFRVFDEDSLQTSLRKPKHTLSSGSLHPTYLMITLEKSNWFTRHISLNAHRLLPVHPILPTQFYVRKLLSLFSPLQRLSLCIKANFLWYKI